MQIHESHDCALLNRQNPDLTHVMPNDLRQRIESLKRLTLYEFYGYTGLHHLSQRLRYITCFCFSHRRNNECLMKIKIYPLWPQMMSVDI